MKTDYITELHSDCCRHIPGLIGGVSSMNIYLDSAIEICTGGRGGGGTGWRRRDRRGYGGTKCGSDWGKEMS